MKPLSVLLVDDERDLREVLRRRLEGAGHRVETAPDGLAALRLFEKGAFDVVLTDLSMPRMSGTELVRRVKAAAPQTITIVLTGFGALESAIEVLRHGCDDYLLKPLASLDLLDQSIRRCVARRDLLLRASTGGAVGATNEEILEFWSGERSRRIAELEDFASHPKASAGAPGPAAPSKAREPKRLLIVDDDEALRDLLVTVFLDQGYEVAATGKGGEALEMALAGGFDAILTDRRLPDIDGAEVIRRLRAAGSTVPIVVVTGYAGCLESGELRRTGAALVILKPVSIKVLLKTIAEVVADDDSPKQALAIRGATGE